jgi:hypothetical protein
MQDDEHSSMSPDKNVDLLFPGEGHGLKHESIHIVSARLLAKLERLRLWDGDGVYLVDSVSGEVQQHETIAKPLQPVLIHPIEQFDQDLCSLQVILLLCQGDCSCMRMQ